MVPFGPSANTRSAPLLNVRIAGYRWECFNNLSR
jgi:hypothetical protein